MAIVSATVRLSQDHSYLQNMCYLSSFILQLELYVYF